MFKLLVDGKLYAADADNNKIPYIYYDVLKVISAKADEKFENNHTAEVKGINAETSGAMCSVPIVYFVE